MQKIYINSSNAKRHSQNFNNAHVVTIYAQMFFNYTHIIVVAADHFSERDLLTVAIEGLIGVQRLAAQVWHWEVGRVRQARGRCCLLRHPGAEGMEEFRSRVNRPLANTVQGTGVF